MTDTKYPILRYFAYAHLPPHLQEVSRPFAELAHAIVANPDDKMATRDQHYELIDFLNAIGATDIDERKEAADKLCMARKEVVSFCTRDALRLILEAKDCAVRAVLPMPTQTGKE